MDVVAVRLPEPIPFHELAERLVALAPIEPINRLPDFVRQTAPVAAPSVNAMSDFVARTVPVRRPRRRRGQRT